MFSLKQIWIF